MSDEEEKEEACSKASREGMRDAYQGWSRQ